MKVNYVIPGKSNDFAKAIDSVDFNGSVDFDATVAGEAGSTPLVLGTLAAGDKSPRGGELVIQGCQDVLLTFNILTGEDCDGCTTDVLTTVPKTIAVSGAPNNGTISYELPNYFFAVGDITVTLIDDADLPTPNPVDLTGVATQTVSLRSCWLPSCPAECKVLV